LHVLVKEKGLVCIPSIDAASAASMVISVQHMCMLHAEYLKTGSTYSYTAPKQFYLHKCSTHANKTSRRQIFRTQLKGFNSRRDFISLP